jgi:hypothetical protein
MFYQIPCTCMLPSATFLLHRIAKTAGDPGDIQRVRGMKPAGPR